jgi:hypothetical protein
MAKISGKDLELWFDSREYPVESVSADTDFDEIETTDSSTPGDGTDVIMNRATRSFKIDQLLRTALGAEVVTGTCVAGTRYLVTGGTVSESPNSYTVGMIFESAGTGALSGTNKVKPLGTVLPGKNVSCTVAAATVPVTSLKFSAQYGEFDATDSSTTGDSKEFITGRAKRATTIEMIMTNTDADKLTTNPTAQAVVLTFGSGLTITGSGIFKKKGAVPNAKGDMVKMTYELSWVGVPVSTLADVLPLASTKAMKIIFVRGASTNKEYTGNAILMSLDIEADVNGVVKASYTGKWSGAVTEAVAN